MKLLLFQKAKSKVIISLFETVRLSVSISLRNLYNSLNSIKETLAVIHFTSLQNQSITFLISVRGKWGRGREEKFLLKRCHHVWVQ